MWRTVVTVLALHISSSRSPLERRGSFVAVTADHVPTVVAIPACGLGNRMRNVNGAVLMAASMNAPMEIKWVETMAHCHAKFSDLFGAITSPNIKVTEISKNTMRESDKSKYGRYNSLAEIPNSVYCEGYCVNYKGKMAPGCQECPWNRTAPVYKGKSSVVVFGCSFCTYEGNAFNEKALLHHGMCGEGLKMYTPPAHVRAVLQAKNISNVHTAGVHIRTGDKMRHTTNQDYRSGESKKGEGEPACLAKPKPPDIAEYYAAGMRELMRKDPAIKRFVVASDNKDVIRLIDEKFKKGTIIHHQGGDAGSTPGVAACTRTLALDLWSLASTKAIIGSYTSTFGYLAAALGDSKPVMYVESCSGKLTAGHYSDDMINDGTGHDLLASHFHTRVFCSSGGSGCAAHGRRRRLFDIHAEGPLEYLSGGGAVDASKLLL